MVSEFTKKRKKYFPIALILLLVLSASAFSACKGAENEIISSSNGNDETEKAEEAETTTAVEEYALTGEEAASNHLTLQVTDYLTIDAYITPSSYYEDGVAVWEPHAIDNGTAVDGYNPSYSCDEMEDDDKVLGEKTVAEVMEAVDILAENLGSVYQTEWESVKEAVDVNTLCFSPWNQGGSVGIYTPNLTSSSLNVMGAIPGERMEFDFLSTETLLDCLNETVNSLFPNVSFHYDLYCREDEACFEVRYYETIEQLPIRYANVSRHIDKGQMSEDSFSYNEGYNDKNNTYMIYGYGQNEERILADVVITETGFSCAFQSPLEYTLYREAQEVLDINAILKKTISALKSYAIPMVVSNIELIMAKTTAQLEDGTWIVVYAPYWIVDYTKELGGELERCQLTWDAYTGKDAWMNYTPIYYEE